MMRIVHISLIVCSACLLLLRPQIAHPADSEATGDATSISNESDIPHDGPGAFKYRMAEMKARRAATRAFAEKLDNDKKSRDLADHVKFNRATTKIMQVHSPVYDLKKIARNETPNEIQVAKNTTETARTGTINVVSRPQKIGIPLHHVCFLLLVICMIMYGINFYRRKC